MGKKKRQESELVKARENSASCAATPLHLGQDCKYEKELRRLEIELVKLQ